MDLEGRIEEAKALLEACALCPRRCGVNRLAGERGFCGPGSEILVASCGPHFGEEPELVAGGGSGTIFLAGCNLRCLFCQNHDISHVPPSFRGKGKGSGPLEESSAGRSLSPAETARIMLSLEAAGCRNVNLVTPTPFAPRLMEAILLARREGLSVPVVYNCGGYESVEVLRLLEGFVEIYMPDLKFTAEGPAAALAGAPDYPGAAREAIREMHRQVGDLEIDASGAAVRGLLVRHLVMPGDLAGSAEAMRFLAGEISRETYVNIMDQYRPCFRAREVPAAARPPTAGEIRAAKAAGRAAGLHRGF